jgi:hypothetical protein
MPLIKTFNCKNSYKFLEKLFEGDTSVFFVVIGKNSNELEVAKDIKAYFKNHPHGQVIILSKLSLLKPIGKEEKHKNIRLIEALSKHFLKENKKVNTVRIGTVTKKSKTLNLYLKQILHHGKLEASSYKNAYYFVSEKDIKKALKIIKYADIKGETFDITLNRLTHEQILNRLEKHFSFSKKIDEVEEQNEKLIDLYKNRIIKFKPEHTIEDFITEYKYKFNTIKPKKKKRLNFKKGLVYLKPVLAACLVIVMLLVIDFGLDNYYLKKSLMAKDIEKSIYYSNKLRNLYLPTKYGKNYTNIYNSIYYALSAYDTYKNSKNVQTESVKTLVFKSSEYALKIEKDLFLTNKEKDLYERFKPLKQTLIDGIEYIDLIKLDTFASSNQNILVLIQNSNEIRPTGGFIGSYALLETDNYKVNNYKFDDIYNVDGTLEEKYPEVLLNVPSTYKDFLSTNYLYTRDLNVILDEKQRNDAILKYFETALNKEIDAVVYLNLSAAKRILNITGPIYLGTYDTEVTSENFDTLAQTYSEQNYYEGSSQKKNFLSVLGARTVKAVEEQKMSIGENTVPQIIESIKNKDALIYIKDAPYNQVVNSLNLVDTIKNPNTNNDYIYILENNLGENKVNKLAEKQVEYNLTYDARRGLKLIDIEIEIKNPANTYSWPYGDYSGLVHIAVPKKQSLTSAKVLSPKKPGEYTEVDITKSVDILGQENVSIINVPFFVKPLSNTKIVLAFEENDKNFIQKTNYSIYVQKQPGAKNYPFTFNYNIPDIKKETRTLDLNSDTEISL